MQTSLAKWKRDAEAWYRKDSTMFEGLLRKVEENVVRMRLLLYGSQLYTNGLSRVGKRK